MIKKIIIIAFVLAVVGGGAYYAGIQSTKIQYVTTTVNLTETERLEVMQEARLNWIPLSEAWDLAEINSIDKINWTDSTRWSFKDSIEVRDSINVVYIPFYEAKDTVVSFDETVDDIRVELSLLVKPRFFPTFNRFITDVQMRHLNVTAPESAESFWLHRWVIYAGWGLTYSSDNLNITAPDYFSHQGWFTGFQFGIGIRLY